MEKKKQEKSNFDENSDSQNRKLNQKSFIVSWCVFLFTLSIVLVSLISVVFPALIVSNNSTITQLEELGITTAEVNPFVTGVWSGWLFAINGIVFVIAILYFKKKLPESVKRLIDFIFRFEVSKKIALITIVILLSIYVVFSASELGTVEEWEDYPGVKQRVESWSPDQIVTRFETHAKYFLLWSSFILFGNYTVIPFLASISLLLITYFFTVKISEKRFAGIVAMVILLQSNVFLTYDSTVSYTNFWIVFYLLSLFLIYRFWPLSSFAYILSLLSKPLTAIFLPMSLFFIFRSNISRNRKIIISSSLIIIILAGILAAFVFDVDLSGSTGSQEKFNSDEFWLGITSFSYQLRFDRLVLLFILPLIVGLFIASKKGIIHAESMMVLIGGILLSAPLLTGFTILTNQPYRFIPLVVFFAIGVGILLTKKNRIIQ